MKRLIFIPFFFLLFLTAVSSQENSLQKSTVLVMPFDRYISYPFHNDLLRESLITGLLEKNFNPVLDHQSWEMVLERDYEFTNLSTNQADTIAIISGADLVMFGFLNDFSTTRSGTLSTTTKHTRPVLIKVYDRKKNALVLYERLTLEANWGLLNNRLTLNQIGTKIAQLLKNQGY
jgi:hypothetical protein